LSDRTAAVLGRQPVRVTPVAGGYTQAERVVAELPGGGRAFVKIAVDELTAGWLRAEHAVYSSVQGSFIPELLGWDDDGERPALALEDLSGEHWPPPWPEGSVASVLRALDELHATPPPPGLPRLVDLERIVAHGWTVVAADPAPFLSLGLCRAEWLEAALPRLCEAEEQAPFDGDAFLHLDVRSDNTCLRDGKALLVDWNQACLGNPDVDVAVWLPSLRAEGGPQPWQVLPDAGAFAAWLAGFFAARAGLPPPPTADPSVRALQRAQLEVALAWTVRELDLPPQ
jgi:Phosphotransferase enzyme family